MLRKTTKFVNFRLLCFWAKARSLKIDGKPLILELLLELDGQPLLLGQLAAPDRLCLLIALRSRRGGQSFPRLCLLKKVFLFPDERLVLILYRSWGARRLSSRFLPFHYLDILYGYTFQLGLLMKIKIIIIILYWVAITKDFQLGFIFLWKFGVKFYPLSLSRTRFGWSFKYFLKLFYKIIFSLKYFHV